MSVIRFTPEQIENLRNNPHVKNVSDKSITYQDSFKEHYLNEYAKGKPSRIIFIEAGFDVSVLGKRYIKAGDRWRRQSKRLEGIKDTRLENTGRPRIKDLTTEEIIQRQQAQIELLKQERDFLLELQRLERQAIKKQQQGPKINTKSSKESPKTRKTN
jgi:hypothetical protein